MKKQNTSLKKNNKGFTLLEVLIAIGIITLAMAAIIGGYMLGGISGKAGDVSIAVQNAKNAIVKFTDSHGGFIPVTESPTPGAISVSGSAASGASITAQSKAATLQAVLLAEHDYDKGFTLDIGKNLNPTGSSPFYWNVQDQAFEVNPDAAPATDYTNCNRVECTISTPGVDPLTAAGANFFLDANNPTQGLASGLRVCYMVLPYVPVALAREISVKIDGPQLSQPKDSSTADDLGSVIYAAPGADGTTTVYIYIVAI